MLLSCSLILCVYARQAFASRPVGQSDAWVRKYPCGPVRPDFPSLESTPFWIDSFRGTWDTNGDTSELRLGILAVHNTTLFGCEFIDLNLLESSLHFELLGQRVGHLQDFWHECPLPVTDALTPLGSDLFSSYQFVYRFSSAHRLQTVVSRIAFHRPDGPELDCAVVKITPDLGNSVSAAFTYTPLGVLALVSLSSWRAHLNGLDISSVLSYDSAFAGQEPLWAMILDIAAYLRYLQFIFVSSLMTLEYPGFYIPAVSKLSWSSLLFWRGPFDYGFSHEGINSGIYVSNSSDGMQFMPQMLGYPNALNTLTNSAINLAILITPVFLALLLLLFKVRQPSQLGSPTARWLLTKAATLSGGIGLCFFSVPLLAYMAYELFLTGYLPNYRPGLAVAMLLVIIGAQYFLTIKTDRGIRLERQSKSAATGRFRRNWRLTAPHFPYFMPLLQTIAVGSLQGWPGAQLSILGGSELALFIHAIFSQRFVSTTTLYSAVRLVTILMSTAFMSPPDEAARQGIGYAMLASHGLVVVLVFPVHALRQWYQSIAQTSEGLQDELRLASNQSLCRLDELSLQAGPDPRVWRLGHDGGLNQHVRQQDTTSFYRTPRPRASQSFAVTSLELQRSQPGSSSHTAIELAPVRSTDARPFDIKLALSEVPERGVDYSIREVDRYYGVASSGSELTTESGHSNPGPEPTSSAGPSVKLRSTYQEGLHSFKKLFQANKQQEKGFEVVRPRRPHPNLRIGEEPQSQEA